jgi:hypothetical protein
VLYLLDANVLITAANLYYPVETVPEFWAWVAAKGVAGDIKMPIETYEEIREGGGDPQRDHLFAWVQDTENRAALLLDEEVNAAFVQRVLAEGYAPDLTDDEIEQIGRDPFLIAYALASPADRCVVTTEVSRPHRVRQNHHVPDVCASMGVSSCDTFAMLRAQRFSTKWQQP